MNFIQLLKKCCFSTQNVPPEYSQQPKIRASTKLPLNYQDCPLKMARRNHIYFSHDQSMQQIKQVNVQLYLIHGKTHNAKLDINITLEELKQYIYKKISDQLIPKLMSLCYNEQQILDTNMLRYILARKGENIIIKQRKIFLWQVSKLRFKAEGEDPLTMEIGTVEMSCGHQIGRDSMTSLIRSLIQKKEYSIKCPNYTEVGLCNAIWDFSLCKKIAVLTKDELSEFETGLSINMIQQQTKQCPKCNSTLAKESAPNLKAACPICGHCFCFNCLEQWNSNQQEFCGNKDCKFFDQLLSQCQWSTVFSLLDQNGDYQTYKTPQYRSCVHCKFIIKHDGGCKHMECSNCGRSFCWVCLSIPQDEFPCGDYNQYCGSTAGVQNPN